MPLGVRRIRANEGAELKRIRLAALQESPAAFGSSYASEVDRADDEWMDRAQRGASGRDRVTYFACDEDRVVGLVGGFLSSDARTVGLVSMWVAPEARRNGVARALVQEVVHWATSVAARRVELWVTRGNEPAYELYESAGFRTTGATQPLPSDPTVEELAMVLVL